MQKTKIVCTIGPASSTKNKIEKLIKAGMDCARLNFSHGTLEYHLQLVSNVRAAAQERDVPIAILQDLQGPKIRIGEMPDEGIELKRNEEVTLQSGSDYENKIIPVNYQNFHKLFKKGDVILIDDGKIKVVVENIKDKLLICKVDAGGQLISNKGINLPTIETKISSITPKDLKDLEFGIKNNVDYVALSFVQEAGDIIELRKIIGKFEKENKFQERGIPSTKIIAKIEKSQAIKNIDDIIRISDGIMIARGDLGVETPIQKVPVMQKEIIKKCLDRAKPVIVATQMLESMTENPSPTRAEVSDVANAVIDHTDAVMLSGESASGKYPVEAAEIMNKIISNTEASPFNDLTPLENETVPHGFAISFATVGLVKKVNAEAIIVTTLSGLTAQTISRYRPEIPIIALVSHEKVRRQMNISWGIEAYVVPKYKNIELLMKKSLEFVKKLKLLKKGDKIIFVSGHPTGKSGVINLVKEMDVP